MKLPSVVYTSEKMEKIIEKCHGSFHEFKVRKIEFVDLIGVRHSSASLNALYENLSAMDPLKRNPVVFEIELKPTGRRKQNIRLTLAATAEESQIELAGGTKKIQQEISDPIRRILQDQTDWWDSTAITTVAPLAIGLGAIIYGWIFPSSAQSAQIVQSSVLAISILVVAYGLKRPHSFILCSWFDHFKLLPGIKSIAVFSVALAFGGSILFFKRTELYRFRINQYVANSPKISSERLKRVLTVEARDQIAALRTEVDAYSKATSQDLKRAAAQKIADVAANLLGPSGPFATESLLLLPIVYSSARKTDPTNSLSQPVLLRLSADSKNAKLTYIARAAEASSQTMSLTNLNNWLAEVVIKDKTGRDWTRIEILNAVKSDSSEENRWMLSELMENSGVDIEFQPFEKDLIRNPQNSVLDETVFAIGVEVLRSVELMSTYHPHQVK